MTGLSCPEFGPNSSTACGQLTGRMLFLRFLPSCAIYLCVLQGISLVLIEPGLKIEVAVLAQRSKALWQGVDFLGVNGTLGLAPVFFVELEQYFTSLLALGCRSAVIVLFDEKVLLTVRTLACSMIQQGLRDKSSLFVCFDVPSLRLARNWSFETVFVESQRALEPFERHKMKLFVPYLIHG